MKKGTYILPETNYSFQKRTGKHQLEHLPKNVETFSYEMDEDTYVPVSLKKQKAPAEAVNTETENKQPEVIAETPKKVADQPKTNPVPASPKGGQIIVGSYSDRKNAEDLINLLQSNGMTGQIVETNGKIRVTAGNASQFSQLEPKLKALGIAPWVLK